MLGQSDNELLTRVEPGTPMHEAFKRYWLPAGLSCDVEPDSPPQRVTMLCEDYVLFRDSQGKVGMLDELCCHRGASLVLGRNEECGLRCIYHGWKFAVDGTVLDMPNSADDRYKQRYRQPAYPVVEKGGLIWVYLGPKDLQPPVPNYLWLNLPADQHAVGPVVYDCNYTQVVDGGADSSHLAVLHQDALGRQFSESRDGVEKRILASAAPQFDTYPTDFGQFSVAIRDIPMEDGKTVKSARLSAFIAPSTVQVTGGHKGAGTWGVAVPVTSEKTVFYIGWFDDSATAGERDAALRYLNIDADSRERLGIDRKSHDKAEKLSRSNNWAQDREMMKSGNRFTGLPLFIPEDIAVAESAGAVYDRTKENLVPADQAIVRIRRIQLEIARDIQENRSPLGVREPAVDTSAIYTREVTLQDGDDWRDLALPPEFRTDSKRGGDAA